MAMKRTRRRIKDTFPFWCGGKKRKKAEAGPSHTQNNAVPLLNFLLFTRLREKRE